jgi:hypothetical protein
MPAGDSFIQDALKNRGRQKQVLDSAQRLGSGPANNFPIAPVQAREEPHPESPLSGGSGVNGDGGISGSRIEQEFQRRRSLQEPLPATAGSDGSGENLTALDRPADPLDVGNIVADVIDDGMQEIDNSLFYQKTGRTMTASDKAFIEARRNFITRRGRAPSKSELIYEAQRSTVTQTDQQAPSIS